MLGVADLESPRDIVVDVDFGDLVSRSEVKLCHCRFKLLSIGRSEDSVSFAIDDRLCDIEGHIIILDDTGVGTTGVYGTYEVFALFVEFILSVHSGVVLVGC